MHAIKGGWVGQTFALAKCNESDPRGKKSRTRRSKEERKGMVESFIKKYQKSNNGNFPSLNLTHKEVGGSFYTVREIVREIIQENRVLGPAKTDLLLQKNDQFLEQNPLGSIAVKPQSSVSIALNEIVQETIHQSLTQVSDGSLNGAEQLDVEEMQTINGQTVEALKDGVDGLDLESVGVEESVEIGEGLDHSASMASTVINLTDVEVETFPLRTVGHMEQSLCEVVTVNGTSLEKMLVSGSESGFDSDLLPEPSLTEDQSSIDHEVRAVSGLAGSSVVKKPVSVDVEAHEVVVEASLATSGDVSEVKDVTIDSKGGAHFSDDSSKSQVLPSTGTKQDPDTAKIEARDGQGSADTTKYNGTYATVDGKKSPQGEKMKTGHDIRSNSKGSLQAGSTPTLDRINLESWEVASKNSRKMEMNPLLAILKAFVVSFVKFWTE